MAIVILLIIIVIVTILILHNKTHSKHMQFPDTGRKQSLDYTGEPFYQEVAKPAPPPLPDHFPELNPQIEAYAVVSNLVEANGGMELSAFHQNHHFVATMHPTAVVETSPVRSDQLPFLEKNPLYASSDNLDEEKQRQQQRRGGSVPSLDVLTDSPRGSQLNIYAEPSRLVPPIPARPSTPELIGESIYNEANLHPTVFQTRRPVPSPPREEVEKQQEEVEKEEAILPCVSVYADPHPLLRSEGPKEVTPDNITEVRNLGVGQFGQVVLANTVGLSLKDLRLSEKDRRTDKPVQVAMKRLKASAEPHIKEAFEKEIKFMSRLHNANVVRLLAICPTGNPFIIMEYMVNGDLNQFLHKHKLVDVEATPAERELTPKQLTHICLQIAAGMKYLATFKFIHRDLATRNCLVGSNLEIKIADFGMSRSLYSSYYYRISGRAMLPIRWMANECFYGKFSEKTDVWAFGVTMWEVFTFSKEQPYLDMTDQEVIDDAIKGPDRLLLPKPGCCPPEVYQVMKQCWIDDPDERARFKDAHSLLEAVYEFGNLQ